MTAWAVASLVCAVMPAILYFRNVRLYRPPPEPATIIPAISVLIPARNEEVSIAPAVRAALASTHVEVEVIVLDDHSSDATAEIVRALATADPRVRLAHGEPLPPGWAGKQFACHTLSKLAQHPVLVFLDADVRLEPTALARLDAFRAQSGAPLVSGFPRQETGTLFEKLLIPLMHFILLGFLPLGRMRKDLRPSLGAGCGQLFLTTTEAYRQVGGHSHPLVRGSFHDGVKLPRAYRTCGFMTDLCDVTDLATCRMYRSAKQVWLGLAKNAGEGIGKWPLIVFATAILIFGQVLPVPFIFAGIGHGIDADITWYYLTPPNERGEASLWPWAGVPLAILASLLTWLPRLHAALHFRQSWLGAVCHPLGITFFLVIQWYAATCAALGRPVGWKGRTQPAVTRPDRPPGPPSP